jgi:hypothetical protein
MKIEVMGSLPCKQIMEVLQYLGTDASNATNEQK